MNKQYTKEELFKMDAVEVYKLVLRRDINRFPIGFWMQPEAKKCAKLCIRFMIEEKLKWADREIKEKISTKKFIENKLGGMLQQVFNNSSYDAINIAYPNKFKEWELKNVPINFWTLDNELKAIKWLIEYKLKWNDENIKEELSIKTFYDNNLGGMLSTAFNDSPFAAINAIYPNKFKEWELNQAPRNFWTLENSIKATTWLIEEKLKWTDDEIKEKLSKKTFKENKLGGMIDTVFNGSSYGAINATFPNRFKKADLKSYQYNITKNR